MVYCQVRVFGRRQIDSDRTVLIGGFPDKGTVSAEHRKSFGSADNSFQTAAAGWQATRQKNQESCNTVILLFQILRTSAKTKAHGEYNGGSGPGGNLSDRKSPDAPGQITTVSHP